MKTLLSMTAMSLVTVLALTGCGGGGSESSNTTPESTKPIVVEQPTLDENTSTVVEEPVVETPVVEEPIVETPVVEEPSVPRTYTLQENIDNKPTVPVFVPWIGNSTNPECSASGETWFNCDSEQQPYSLVWLPAAQTNIGTTDFTASENVLKIMNEDPDTLYLVNDQWNYWYPRWNSLSEDSPFYTENLFGVHELEDSPWDTAKMINYTHPDFPAHVAARALAHKEAGIDGFMWDWWHDGAGEPWSDKPFATEEETREARVNIAKAVREAVGEDFIIMGNVNWAINDPAAEYMSGTFLELYQTDNSGGYVLTYADETDGSNTPSWERLEDLLKWWNDNLAEPRIVASAPQVYNDSIADRTTNEQVKNAKLHTAMAMVIPENGYILFADKGQNHHFQHEYYDFYHTDFGKATSSMIEVSEGVGYKTYETGVIAYNRTANDATITLEGINYTIGALEGKFIQK